MIKKRKLSKRTLWFAVMIVLVFIGSMVLVACDGSGTSLQNGSDDLLGVPEDSTLSTPDAEMTDPFATLPEDISDEALATDDSFATDEPLPVEEAAPVPVEEPLPTVEDGTDIPTSGEIEVPLWVQGVWTDANGVTYTISANDIEASDWGTSLANAVLNNSATFTIGENTETALAISISWLDATSPTTEELSFSYLEGTVNLVRSINGTESISGPLSQSL